MPFSLIIKMYFFILFSIFHLIVLLVCEMGISHHQYGQEE